MARPTFTVQLDKRVLERLIRQAPDKADDKVEELGREGERFAKQLFGPGPAPSSPGGPPNVQTGFYRASISLYRPAMLQRILSAGADYAVHLEFGTRKMAARPVFIPTVAHLREEAPRVFNGFLGD